MDIYPERVFTELVTSVSAQGADPGTADVRVRLNTNEHEIALTSRVSREDLPKLISVLIDCLPEGERAAFLAVKLGSCS